MLVSHQNQPFSVELIDFGLTLQTREGKAGLITQPVESLMFLQVFALAVDDQDEVISSFVMITCPVTAVSLQSPVWGTL